MSILPYQIDVDLMSKGKGSVINLTNYISRQSVCKDDVELSSKNELDLCVNSASKTSRIVMKINRLSNYRCQIDVK